MKSFKRKKNVEILCIGTELLLGNILNGNSRWIAEELAALGMPHFRQGVVGDNMERLKEAILECSERCNILITTGGLGPTPDDLTTEAMAQAFGVKLQIIEEVKQDIKEKLTSKGKSYSLNNEKQALVPEGSKIMPNSNGTAPGIIWNPIPGFTIISFPGVPSEMKKMWSQSALPWLEKNANLQGTIASKLLRFTGIAESKLAEDLSDLLHQSNPTIAPYAELGEVKLRVTAKASNAEEVEQLMNPCITKIRERTKTLCYGSEQDSLASVVIDLLRKKNEKLVIAESCTGGGLGAALTAVPGASDVFLGGVITYSNDLKQKLLGVNKELLQKHGAVSAQVAEAMAKGVKEKLGADWAIAITGLAGPLGGNNKKPVGLVFCCIANRKFCSTKKELFGNYHGRAGIQHLSIVRSLDELRLLLLSGS
ncbi:competence/damage-inducible protein A [Prochlorococcus sp. MIT 1300]|uniref:competence/damage-inducible protein A n=1 Tax=Prochlorococcus sp. MIT 1300 TaxID=3096218 RepID=UPI002A75280F|nr:competence/damage-inducible protein A [Prochlorococcus sp. MIT 1300]